VVETSPTKKMTPFAGGALKYFSLAKMDWIAPWTFFLVPWDLMLEDWESSSLR